MHDHHNHEDNDKLYHDNFSSIAASRLLFLSMELNIVVEFCVCLLYSEKGEDTAWPYAQ